MGKSASALSLICFTLIFSSCGGGGGASDNVTPKVTLTSIAITPATASIAKGQNTHFTATGTFSNGTIADISGQTTWSTGDTSVATIDSTTGVATGVGVGNTTVTASSNGITSPAASLSVTAAVITGISISPTTPSAPKGIPVTFTAIATYSDGSSGNVSGSVTWVSSNTSVATLNSSGIASTLALGSTIITASANGINSNSATLTVTVPELINISITSSTASVVIGSTNNFTANGIYTDGTSGDITNQVSWVSSNVKVATIDTSGIETVLAKGGTTITASLSGITSNGVTLVTPMVSAGGEHSVGLKSDGTVVTWGWNQYGQLGIGTTGGISLLPVAVPGLSGVVAIAAGYDHTVALKSDGTVVAWGGDQNGQLGDGTTGDSVCHCRSTPVTVLGLSGVVSVAAGSHDSVALKSDGTVVGWGWNDYGQLGDGTTTSRTFPVAVPGLTGVKAVSAGAIHTVALKTDGTLMAWGYNLEGELGDGTIIQRWSPVAVPLLSNVVAVAAGGYHTVALKSDGTLMAWGWNRYGELGDGTEVQQLSPVNGPALVGITTVVTGGDHTTVALKSDGTLMAWGLNNYGQLGNGSTTNSSNPVAVLGISDAVAVSAGLDHNIAIKSDGTVMTWGWNQHGQLGDGTTTDKSTPVSVPGLNLL
jgi:alpha-tubulin suppressor-like RCC1 family protein/uncharacterized protein YjdB